MNSDANYCLKGPQDQIVGFRLGTEELGHEIYDILDWADEHFESYDVEQTNNRVYVYSEAARASLNADEVRTEPLSIENDGEGDSSSGDSSGGPSSGGPSGGSGGSGPGGNAPAGDPSVGSGGGAAAEPAGL